MSGDDWPSAIFYVLILLLPLSALLARRIPLGQTARMAAAWLGIFAVGLLIVTAATRAGVTRDGLSQMLGLSDQLVTGSTIAVPKAEDGHFWTTVRIGSQTRRMLIDSGATTTSISLETAQAAGIDATADKFGAIVNTANGPIIERRATAPSIEIGAIHVKDLDILVGRSDGPEVIGMNFLSALKSWRVEGDRMILEPRKP